MLGAEPPEALLIFPVLTVALVVNIHNKELILCNWSKFIDLIWLF